LSLLSIVAVVSSFTAAPRFTRLWRGLPFVGMVALPAVSWAVYLSLVLSNHLNLSLPISALSGNG